MNGAPNEPRGSEVGPGGEDLDVVLGCFQTWAKTRRENPVSGYGTSAGIDPRPSSKKAKQAGEARELSYEQALRVSHYRRPIETAPVHPVPPDATTNQAAASKVERTQCVPGEMRTADLRPTALRSPRQTPKVEARPIRAAHTAMPEPQTAKVDTTAKQRSLRSTPIVIESLPPEVSLPQKFETPPKISITARPVLPDVLNPGNSQTSDNVSMASAKPSQIPMSTGKRRRAEPAFREVLEGTAALVASVQPGALERMKTASLTLRVSEGEQARIQACAAQANLSVSAYLRQCALSVDTWRDQVGLALSDLHKQQTQPAAQPGLRAIPGILGRFAVHCMRRLRPGSGSGNQTVLSLR